MKGIFVKIWPVMGKIIFLLLPFPIMALIIALKVRKNKKHTQEQEMISEGEHLKND